MTAVQKRQIEVLCSTKLQELLSRRGLSHPDGRRLYAYHITDSEYEEVRQLLASMTAFSSWEVLSTSTSFKALWFLHASEWWKRSYSGGAWGWHGIFNAFGIDEPGQQEKRDCVEVALHFWRQQALPHLGRRYLGMVILNAGLPARLLEDSSGRLSNLLRLVLLRVGNLQTQQKEDLREAVQEQIHLLPMTYRHGDGIPELLADIAHTVLELRQIHALTDTSNPVEKLEQVCPEWQKQFPLRLDGAAASALLKGLIHDAIQAARSTRMPFSLRRGFRLDSQGEWHQECHLDAVSRIGIKEFADKLQVSENSLPNTFDLSLRTEGKALPIGRAMMSDDSVIVRISNITIPESWFDKSITLGISRFGELIADCPLPGGSAPSEEMPWVLSDTEPFAGLIAVGSARVSASSALTLLPLKATIFSLTQDEERIAQIGGKTLCRLQAGEWHIASHGDSYAIRCQPGIQCDETLLWHGERLILESHPEMIFKGHPKLFRVIDGSRVSVPIDQLFWRRTGDKQDQRLDLHQTIFGMGSLRWKEGQNIRSKLQAICLPAQAGVKYSSGDSPREGKIHLAHWPVQSIALTNPHGIALRIRQEAPDNWELSLRVESDHVPANITLQLNWPGSGIQTLTLPFPAQGITLGHESGHSIKAGKNICVEELLGLRARLFSPKQHAKWSLLLKLKGCGIKCDTERRIPFLAGQRNSAIHEISLYELIEPVRQMLSAVENLDARVDMSFDCEGLTYRALTISRYGHDVEPDFAKNEYRLRIMPMPDHEDLLSTRVKAINLQHPDQIVTLTPLLSEGVHRGSWWFNPAERSPGNWLIYPEADAPLTLRPMAWSQSGQDTDVTEGGLGMTIGLPHKEKRLESMVIELQKMAKNPDSPDWQWLQSALHEVGHLPLSSLDVLIALSRVPAAMVMAHISLDGFAEHYSPRVAHELPFEWTLTSPAHWRLAVHYYHESLRNQSDGMPSDICKLLIKHRLHAARTLSPGISMALNRAEDELEGRSPSDWQSSPTKLIQTLDGQLINLFGGEHCAMQQMMRRNSPDREIWPERLKRQVQEFALSPEGMRMFQLLGALQDDFKFSVIGLPIVLAFEVHTDRSAHWRESHADFSELKTYRAFDPQWFDDAYQTALVCATCLEQLRNQA